MPFLRISSRPDIWHALCWSSRKHHTWEQCNSDSNNYVFSLASHWVLVQEEELLVLRLA